MTLETILLGALGFILAGVIGWWRGRSTGKSDAQNIQNKAAIDAVRKIHEVKRDVETKSDSDLPDEFDRLHKSRRSR